MINIAAFASGSYLPMPGEVYWVDTAILSGYDKKPRRPVLVVELPHSSLGRITVVTRTSSRDRSPGVHSEANVSLGLNRPGTWGYERTADASLWTPSNVSYSGEVDGDELYDVRVEFNL